jgi:universal stress protein E
MTCFQNILVGVDLTQCEQFSVEALPAITQYVFHRSVLLAQKTGARLTFLSALNLTAQALNTLAEKRRLALTRTIEANAGLVLAELARRAKDSGVSADTVFVRGKGWLELIRQALRGSHDLVFVGTRNLTGVRRMLLGNTALKLFRRCPCPVWVSRPAAYDWPLNLLVASDLQPVSETALHLALCLGQVLNANVHVLHVIKHPFYHLSLTGLHDEDGTEYTSRMRARAEQVLHEQLQRGGAASLARPVRLHFLDSPDDRADEAIHGFLDEYAIDLLIMGTIGRGGIAGVTIGNTAERLLPEVPCSVLAVKPPDFICPVSL